MSRLIWVWPLIALSAGCATRNTTLYAWGDYETVIYQSFAAPGKYPVQLQIETLQKNFQEARANNAQVPPGWHAHLGYLYYQSGQGERAIQEFMSEKVEFPESAVLMDRMLASASKP